MLTGVLAGTERIEEGRIGEGHPQPVAPAASAYNTITVQ